MNFEERMREMERLANDPEYQAAQEAEIRQRRDRMLVARAKKKAELVEKFGVHPKDIVLLTIGTQDTAAVQALDGQVGLSVLSGGPGTGKTTAAAVWLWRWVHDPSNWFNPEDDDDRPEIATGHFKRGTALLISAAKLSRWSHYDDKEMERLFKFDRLVIDDIGAEYVDSKGFYSALLDEVINERYSNHKTTLLTTNLTVDEFKARYGERITDRIRECGKFISVGNKSMRGKS